MLHLAVISSEGTVIPAKDVPTAAELHSLADQARTLIREFERLAQQKKGATAAQVPYSS
jgi:hypothetical protein